MHGNMATRAAAAAYTHVEVTSRSPLELVVMLYDGGITALTQARDALLRRDMVAKRRSLTKALSIIAHLQSSLNMDDGREVAVQLDQLYDYMVERITASNISGTPEGLDEAIRLLGTVREGWAQLSSTSPPAGAR